MATTTSGTPSAISHDLIILHMMPACHRSRRAITVHYNNFVLQCYNACSCPVRVGTDRVEGVNNENGCGGQRVGAMLSGGDDVVVIFHIPRLSQPHPHNPKLVRNRHDMASTVNVAREH